MLEKENEALKFEAQNIFGPLEEKVSEVTEMNVKYERKIKSLKNENKELKQRLEKIEEEVEQLTLRGFGSNAHMATKTIAEKKEKRMITAYEQQLEEKENEIRALLTQKRNLQEDLNKQTRKLRYKEKIDYSPETEHLSPSGLTSPAKSSAQDEPVLHSLLTNKQGGANEVLRTRAAVRPYDYINSKENRHPGSYSMNRDPTTVKIGMATLKENHQSFGESSEVDIKKFNTVQSV